VVDLGYIRFENCLDYSRERGTAEGPAVQCGGISHPLENGEGFKASPVTVEGGYMSKMSRRKY